MSPALKVGTIVDRNDKSANSEAGNRLHPCATGNNNYIVCYFSRLVLAEWLDSGLFGADRRYDRDAGQRLVCNQGFRRQAGRRTGGCSEELLLG